MNCKQCMHFRIGAHYDPNKGIIIDDSKLWGICLNPLIKSDYVDSWERRDTDSEIPNGGIYSGCDEDRGMLKLSINFGCINYETLKKK